MRPAAAGARSQVRRAAPAPLTGRRVYGIFDTFASENGRQAHIAGPLAEALGKAADELLASDPSIRPVDVIAVK